MVSKENDYFMIPYITIDMWLYNTLAASSGVTAQSRHPVPVCPGALVLPLHSFTQLLPVIAFNYAPGALTCHIITASRCHSVRILLTLRLRLP